MKDHLLKKFITVLACLSISSFALATVWAPEDFTAAPIEKYTSKAKEEILAPLEAKKNFSGLTYVPETKSYFAIINKGDRLFEFDDSFKLKRTIKISGFDDPEDLAFVKMTDKGPLLAISEEPGGVFIGIIGAGTELSASSMQRVSLVDEAGRALEFNDNKGLEGITYIPQEEKFIVVKESSPMKVWSFQLPADTGAVSVKVKNVLPAETISAVSGLATDLSAVSYHSKLDSIVLLSDESSKIIYVDNKTKQVTKVIDLKTKLQHEGLAFSADFETTYVGAEPYYLLRVNKANTTQAAR
jgi:uncharacterized protein YjiK